ncbi:hypothetical protein DW004_12950 [Firmicutes bacterium AF36-3BH]|nr:hypothetical protein DW004_12950 [Firmicutes bacterium AF36-3BH]
MQQFNFEELIKNTSVDMNDDGFKPSSHSPIIDHEVENDIDELIHSATVAESDNPVPANHFYNFDDDNEDDDNLGIDIDALISSTLPRTKMTLGLHHYIKISALIVPLSIVIVILIL